MNSCMDTYVLLTKIVGNSENAKFLSISRQHLNTLLEHAQDVKNLGSEAFVSKEEYQKFIIAKFYIDKCVDLLTKPTSKEIEEGEINSDTEEQTSDKPVERIKEIPPLEAFHLSTGEKKRRLYNFWRDVKEGDLYHAKVIQIVDEVYDLLVINKYLNDERLIDLNINAYLKKSSVKENLRVNDVVRVSVIGCVKVVGNSYKLVVTADTAVVKIKVEPSIKLGKISATELPFPPIEAHKFRSLTQYVTAHCINRDPKSLVDDIKALHIDPYKAYCLHPELDGKKGVETKRTKHEYPKNVLDSTAALKQAMMWQEKNDIQRALTCVNRALELNPKSDLALVTRGALYVKKADNKYSEFLLYAIQDYCAALQLNSHCREAIKEVSALLSVSAMEFLKEGCIQKCREAMDFALALPTNKPEGSLMTELAVYLSKNKRTLGLDNIQDS